MSDTRLIERWLPIAELGIESTRERTPMTPFPAPNRLHVWWARRPLVASRAAILASLLPADADREKFMQVLGIHGDPVAARTITCLYCDGLVPLSPNWRLAPGGIGVRLRPNLAGRVCSFEIVESAAEQSHGTVSRGDGTCPYDDCGRVIDGDHIKAQAQAGDMGEQLYAVVTKERVLTKTKTGKTQEKWIRRYRAPRPEDDNSAEIEAALADKLPEWEVLDMVPSERIPDGNKTTAPHRYGMPLWRDLFSSRQFLCHGTSVEVFREMLDADRKAGNLSEVRRARFPRSVGAGSSKNCLKRNGIPTPRPQRTPSMRLVARSSAGAWSN